MVPRFCLRSFFRAAALALFLGGVTLRALADDSESFRKTALLLRQRALFEASPTFIMVPAKPPFTNARRPNETALSRYPWRLGITTTVFWVGEQATINNPVANDKSAWDGAWFFNYGGYDTPDRSLRRNFVPLNFLPGTNPFYVALPYNDVEEHHTKIEAPLVVPWFPESFVRDGESVCKGRWLAIRHGNRVCYAQWEDVGPFTTDDWPYVFGKELPRPNRNQDAGLDVSPAVRDYLQLGDTDSCDWKFVDALAVPPGPWAVYGTTSLLRTSQLQKRAGTINEE
jgi:hypothetical protein